MHTTDTSYLMRSMKLSIHWTWPQSRFKDQPFLFPSPLPSKLEHRLGISTRTSSLQSSWILHCVVEKPFQEMNILAGTWLSIYNTDNTCFSKSHFYSSIHVIIAEKEKKKVQLQYFHILNKFCSAEKKKKNIKPKCHDNNCLCLPRLFPFSWFPGWTNRTSWGLTFMNSAPK